MKIRNIVVLLALLVALFCSFAIASAEEDSLTVEIEGVKISILETRIVEGDRYNKPSDGNILLAIMIHCENSTEKEFKIFSDNNFKLYSADGLRYDQIKRLAEAQGNLTDTILGHKQMKGEAVFDVPMDIKTFDLRASVTIFNDEIRTISFTIGDDGKLIKPSENDLLSDEAEALTDEIKNEFIQNYYGNIGVTIHTFLATYGYASAYNKLPPLSENAIFVSSGVFQIKFDENSSIMGNYNIDTFLIEDVALYYRNELLSEDELMGRVFSIISAVNPRLSEIEYTNLSTEVAKKALGTEEVYVDNNKAYDMLYVNADELNRLLYVKVIPKLQVDDYCAEMFDK